MSTCYSIIENTIHTHWTLTTVPSSPPPFQLITLETTLRLYWRDPRLQVEHLLPGQNETGDDYVLLHPDASNFIWFPDIYIGERVRHIGLSSLFFCHVQGWRRNGPPLVIQSTVSLSAPDQNGSQVWQIIFCMLFVKDILK